MKTKKELFTFTLAIREVSEELSLRFAVIGFLRQRLTLEFI